MKNSKDYVQRKIDHANRFGCPAMRSPETGAATMQWIVEQREAEKKRLTNRQKKND